jgi:trehalose/maltose hydrolase-like predicted phosphorylase
MLQAPISGDPVDDSYSYSTQAAYFYYNTPQQSTNELKGVMGPHERIVNNDLYSNLIAQWILDGWNTKPGELRFKLPRDDTTFLTYDGDDLSTYQQASAVLAIYPLQYPEAEKEARLMMERFENKVTENGPAMSDSIHAVIRARLGEKQKAYDAWQRSWRRYTNHPLLLFSEKPKVERTYFVTGAAGCLQSVLYGFLGFRIDSQKDPAAAWSKPLLGGQFLTVKPNLPMNWKSVTLKNFTVLGKRYTLTATHDAVRVKEGSE